MGIDLYTSSIYMQVNEVKNKLIQKYKSIQ